MIPSLVITLVLLGLFAWLGQRYADYRNRQMEEARLLEEQWMWTTLALEPCPAENGCPICMGLHEDERD